MLFPSIAAIASCLLAVNAVPQQHRLIPSPPNSRLVQFNQHHLEWVPVNVLESDAVDVDVETLQLSSVAKKWLLQQADRAWGPGYIDVTAHQDAFSPISRSQLTENEQNNLVSVWRNGEIVGRVLPQSLLSMTPKLPAFPTEPTQMDRIQPWLALLQSKNLKSTIQTLSEHFPTRHHRSEYAQSVADWVRDQFSAFALDNDRSDVKVELFHGPSTKQPSVIASIPGSDPSLASEVVVIGAHEDSISSRFSPDARAPGADDDASGLACVLEIFRVLMESSYRPKRTVQFMAYAAEEAGLLGSKDIARAYHRQGVNVVAMLQMEMAGYKKQGSKGYVTVIQDSSKPMVNYIYMLAQAYISPNAQDSRVRFTKCGYGCSDQDSWITEGFQATGIAEAGPHDSDLNPNIHTRLDALNILDMEFLLLFAKVGLAYVVEMAL